MDLSVQKMQPPATVQGKSAAKKSTTGSSDDAVETVERDQELHFKHGNTGYDAAEREDDHDASQQERKRKRRRKNRQMLSQDDLSELTSSLEEMQAAGQSADGLMNYRAYKCPPPVEQEEKEHPHFEVNI